MAKPRGAFRRSHRDVLLANKRALDDMADLAGKPRMDYGDLIPPAPVKRATNTDAVHRGETAERPLEATVIRAVEKLLAVHPMVLFVLRMNAGSASYEAKSGKYAPIFFHRWVKGAPFRMSDFMGATKDCRVLALEVKRPGFHSPHDQREREQANFLECVRSNGGRAGFVTSADEAQALIEAHHYAD